MKTILIVLATPMSLISIILGWFGSASLHADLEDCLELTTRLGESVPDPFVDAVILAEDHRNKLHPGIDVIAMFRAVWVRISLGQIQGASTIEQQFVRVVTGRHERTIPRKMREQILALMLVRRVSKRRIASAYLAIAFYGSGSIGLDGLRDKFGKNLGNVAFYQALGFVAQLKYPRPSLPSKEWSSKLAVRINALHGCAVGMANKRLQSDAAFPRT
ncbi:MAG: biosynthetic peptidoglycan transglycosylase [Moraxellaceae bacterium]|nr:biosynthetic peptidoglycan transglycosylase [Moraxellaceae bacterium]